MSCWTCCAITVLIGQFVALESESESLGSEGKEPVGRMAARVMMR